MFFKKTNKFLLFIIIGVLVLSVTGFTVLGEDNDPLAAPIPADDARYYMNIDFTDESVLSKNAFSLTPNGGTIEVVDEVIETGSFDEDGEPIIRSTGDKMLRMKWTPLEQGVTPRIVLGLPYALSSGKIVYEWEVRVSDPQSNSSGGPQGAEEFVIRPSTQGITIGSGATQFKMVPQARAETWYKFTYVLDYDNKVFDIYLDGLLVVSKEPMSAASTTNLVFKAWPNGTAVGKEHTNDYKNIRVWEYSTYEELEDGHTISEKYAEKLELLKTIGIWNTDILGEFDENKAVTRGELLRILPLLHGLDESGLGNSEDILYKDIGPDSPFFRTANYAFKMGLMNGNGSGYFYPENSITTIEAIKPLITLLGYAYEAQAKGGFPKGYLLTASRLNMTKNIKIDDHLTQGTFAELIYNMLEIDVAIDLGMSKGESVRYDIQKGVNIMTEYLKIKTGIGIVTGNSVSGIATPYGGGKNLLEIDYVKYNNDNYIYDKYIGYRVRYYLDTLDNENKIVFIAPYRTDVLTVCADDISREESNDARFVYENDYGSKQQIEVGNQLLIFNEVAAGASYTAEDLQPKSGYVTFIDNNSDGNYDIISVVSYDNFVTSGSNVKDGYIYRKYGGDAVKLEDYVIYRDSDNTEVDISAVVDGRVVAVMQSLDKQHSKVFIISKAVSGTMIELEEIGSSTYYTIQNMFGAKKYERSAFYTPITPTIAVNYGGEFQLDIDGKVIAPSEDTNAAGAYHIGYLLKAEASGGLNATTEFKIFNATGGVVNLKGISNIKIDSGDDNFITLGGQKLIDELRRTAANKTLSLEMSSAENQLIGYRVNSENQITVINRTVYSYDIKSGVRYYGSSGGVFLNGNHGPFFPKESTIIFCLPTTTDKFDAQGNTVTPITIPDLNADVRRYKIASISDLGSGNVRVEGYNLDDMCYVDVVVLCGTPAPTIDRTVRTSIVTGVSQIINEYDEIVHKVTALRNSKEETIIVDPLNGIPAPRVGDIIRYSVNASGTLAALTTDFSPGEYSIDNLPPFNISTVSYTSDGHFARGFLYKTSNSGIVISNKALYSEPESDTQLWPYRFSNDLIYLYNVKENRVLPINSSVLKEYMVAYNPKSVIFCRGTGGRSQFICVVDYSE